MIGKWTTWKIGNRARVHLGQDPWIRGEGIYLMSNSLISVLANCGLRYLADIGICRGSCN